MSERSFTSSLTVFGLPVGQELPNGGPLFAHPTEHSHFLDIKKKQGFLNLCNACISCLWLSSTKIHTDPLVDVIYFLSVLPTAVIQQHRGLRRGLMMLYFFLRHRFFFLLQFDIVSEVKLDNAQEEKSGQVKEEQASVE